MSQKELKELQKQIAGGEIKKLELAFILGYLTHTTLDHWFRDKRIPRLALPKVRLYLKQSKGIYAHSKTG